MKRAVLLLAILLAGGMGLWLYSRPAAKKAAPKQPIATSAAEVKPELQPRATVKGRVATRTGKPIAGARVCARPAIAAPTSLLRAQVCTASYADGSYSLGNLLASGTVVSAQAASYLPADFRAGSDRWHTVLELAAGETREHVDLTLQEGGLEIAGKVTDLEARPIVGALVRVQDGATTVSDQAGHFSLWLGAGAVILEVSAEGHASRTVSVTAPSELVIALAPGSRLSGIVVDAGGTPVEDALVRAFGDELEVSERSGRGGRYSLDGLPPGDYALSAVSANGAGKGGTVRLGLAEDVEAAEIVLQPAYVVAGQVMQDGQPVPCNEGSVHLVDREANVSAHGQGLLVMGVLPGHYQVSLSCPGVDVAAPDLEVKDHDRRDLVWQATAGNVLRGHVRLPSGAPVAGAMVSAQRLDGSGGTNRTDQDGLYLIHGLDPGTYTLTLAPAGWAIPGERDSVEVRAGTTEHDLQALLGGNLSVSVVDDQGRPVPGAAVTLEAPPGTYRSRTLRSDDAGRVVFDGVEPGPHELHEPDADDAAWSTVYVEPGVVTRFKLTAYPAAAIEGVVVDETGTPIAGVLVRARPDAGGPVLSGADGSFRLSPRLASSHQLIALQEGGASASVDAMPGDAVRLQLSRGGTLAGRVIQPGGPLPLDLMVLLEDRDHRRLRVALRADGSFELTGLPPGRYGISARAPAGETSLTVDVLAGRRTDDVDLVLEPRSVVVGRAVDVRTHQPVPGVTVRVDLGQSGPLGLGLPQEDVPGGTSGNDGRFTLQRVSPGRLTLRAGNDWFGDRYAVTVLDVEVPAGGRFDLGELPMVPNPTFEGRNGTSGLRVTPGNGAVTVETSEVSGIVAGDRIVSVDGLRLATLHWETTAVLLQGAPGQTMALELERGGVVSVTLR